MASQRKIAANRRNAEKSTGPRSAAGKARVKANAWKHGLAAIYMNRPQAPESEWLAIAIAGASASLDRLVLARAVAEAQLELQRVGRARLVLMKQMLVGETRRSGPWPHPQVDPHEIDGEKAHRGSSADASKHCNGSDPELPLDPDLLVRLSKLDRYERRAWSRWMITLAAYDGLQ